MTRLLLTFFIIFNTALAAPKAPPKQNNSKAKKEIVDDILDEARLEDSFKAMGQQLKQKMPDKKQAESLIKFIKDITLKQNKEIREFLNTNFDYKELKNLKSMLFDPNYRRILQKVTTVMAEQQKFQTFIQKEQDKIIKKEKKGYIKKLDPLLNISGNIKSSMDVSVEMIRKNLKGKVSDEQIEAILTPMVTNMKPVYEKSPFFALKDIEDGKLKMLLKTIDNKTYKKYHSNSIKIQQKYQKEMLDFIFKSVPQPKVGK